MEYGLCPFLLEGEQYRVLKKRNSLQTLCVQCIAKNFDKLFLSYSTTVDVVQKANVQALQRFYSSQLLQTLSSTNSFLEAHLNFLINEHLKEVDIGIFETMNQEAVIKRVSEVGNSFTVVKWVPSSTAMPTKESIEFLNHIVCHLSNVTTLWLGTSCTDETLMIISDCCPKLEELTLEKSHISDEGLRALCHEGDDMVESKCPNLVNLSLTDILLDNTEGLMYLLKNVPSLEVVDHVELPNIILELIKEGHFSDNVRKLNLITIFIESMEMNSNLTEALTLIPTVCPRLKALVTDCLTKAHLHAICQIKTLEDLTAVCIPYALRSGSEHLNFNRVFKSIGLGLKELHLIWGSISVCALIENCPNMEFLHLKDPHFHKIENTTEMMHKLTEMKLERVIGFDERFKQSLCTIFDSAPNLKIIHLRHCIFIEVIEIEKEILKMFDVGRLRMVIFDECTIDERRSGGGSKLCNGKWTRKAFRNQLHNP